MSALDTDDWLRREFKVFVNNFLKHLTLITTIEGRSAIEHLEDEYSKTPPVYCKTMTLI